MRRPLVRIIGAIGLSLVVLSGGAAIAAMTQTEPSTTAQVQFIDTTTTQTGQTHTTAAAINEDTATDTPLTAVSVAELEGSLIGIYEQVNPSVVNIQVMRGNSAVSRGQGAGSGFVWDTNGHIVTNNHVIAGASRISVIFADGTSVPAQIVGTDPNSDLAVVRVDLPATRLQPVQIADSTQAKVGELVVAIGNPFGLDGTMTVGFVSALGRSLPVSSGSFQQGSYTIPDIIQTDAPINPGNSGGVLVDDQGRLVGVTTAIESPVRASAGIGFAVPSVIVQKVVPGLIANGSYTHPWLGISGGTLSPAVAEAMGLSPEQRGTLVAEVVNNGPAAQAGLRGSTQQVSINGQPTPIGGDVIIAVDNQPVADFGDMITYLARRTEVNQQIMLTMLREGQQINVPVVLQARPGA